MVPIPWLHLMALASCLSPLASVAEEQQPSLLLLPLQAPHPRCSPGLAILAESSLCAAGSPQRRAQSGRSSRVGRGVQPLLSLQTDVFIAMELMGTCAEKLKKRMQGPIPERILGKMTVAVSGLEGAGGQAGAPQPRPPRHRSVSSAAHTADCEGALLPEGEARRDPP